MSVATPAAQSPRILVAYVTAGAGHRRAAEALADSLRGLLPQAEIHCHDVLRDAPRWFHQGYSTSYLFLVRHASWIWKFTYACLDRDIVYRCVQPLRRLWNLFIVRRWIKRLKAHPYDLIIVTHFLPADVCSAGRRAGWLTSRFIVVVTDYHPHWFWVSKQPDAMVAAVAESAVVLQQRGVEPSRIAVIGIPVAKSFGEPVDRAALREHFSLDFGRRAVLVTSGGTTVGQFEEVVEAIRLLEPRLPGRLQLLVVCGEDSAMQQRLEQNHAHGRMPMRLFGFVDFMADLMAVSDLIVSKAGGLTVSESLASGVPLILYHIIPGQEQMNAEYVARSGAAIIARKPAEAGEAVFAFFNQPDVAHRMRQAVAKMAHPDASLRIVNEVVLPLLSRSTPGCPG